MLENEPFDRIWLEKLEGHRFSLALAGKTGILFLNLIIINSIVR